MLVVWKGDAYGLNKTNIKMYFIEGTRSFTRTVTVYYNGSITYSIEGLDVSLELLPGVSVGGSSSMLYRYSVSTTFTESI